MTKKVGIQIARVQIVVRMKEGKKEMNRNEMAKNGDECVSTSYSQLSHFAMSHYFRAMLAPLLLLLLLFCFIHYQLVRCDAGNFSEPNELPSTRLSVYSLYIHGCHSAMHTLP